MKRIPNRCAVLRAIDHLARLYAVALYMASYIYIYIYIHSYIAVYVRS